MDFVVDAHSGRVVAELPRTPSIAASTETAVDGVGLPRRIRVESDGSKKVLRDSKFNVETFDFRFGDPIVDEARLPGRAIKNPPKWSAAAVSAHANAVVVAEFLHTVLLRNNIDNNGSPMRSSINCVVLDESPGDRVWANAFWNNRQMVYGQVMNGGKLRSLCVNVDIVAHEMFHGVTEHTSRLEYAFQPGALNESYSDIFGAIVSNWAEPDPRNWDWEIGEGLLANGKPFRDMSDPARFRQPAHMRDFKVLPNTQSGDWGGVHINSGIHNKAAFNVFTAEDARGNLILTPQAGAAIFYLALTQQLSRTSQFSDSRRGVLTSARTLLRALPRNEQATKLAAIESAFADVGIV